MKTTQQRPIIAILLLVNSAQAIAAQETPLQLAAVRVAEGLEHGIEPPSTDAGEPNAFCPRRQETVDRPVIVAFFL